MLPSRLCTVDPVPAPTTGRLRGCDPIFATYGGVHRAAELYVIRLRREVCLCSHRGYWRELAVAPVARTRGRSTSVLVVDDDALFRELVITILRRAGYRTSEAA